LIEFKNQIASQDVLIKSGDHVMNEQEIMEMRKKRGDGPGSNIDQSNL
jgi:hypothetical protein